MSTKPTGTQPIMIIRHGATRLNNADVSVDRIRGWKDVPLSADGREEAERLGEKLKSDPPAMIVTSDLARARETAEIIAQKIGMKVSEVTQGLRPWNVGNLTGQQTKAAIPILAKYATDQPNKPLPDGESFHDFEARFFTTLLQLTQKYGAQGRLALVTHHRDERLLKAWQAAGFQQDGEIDKSIFNQKGEHTGCVIPMDLSIDKVTSAARALEAIRNQQHNMRNGNAALFNMGTAS